jgi:hypothetical protein
MPGTDDHDTFDEFGVPVEVAPAETPAVDST